MSFIFAVTVLVVNIVLWVLLLARFRSLFDTGDIVDKTREEITELTRDLNRVAQRDIGLFNECSKQLHDMLDEADKKIVLLKEEEQKAIESELSIQEANEKLKAMKEEFVRGTASEQGTPARGGTKKRAINSYKKTASKKQANMERVPHTDAALGDASRMQKPLFDDKVESININVPALQADSGYAIKNEGRGIYLSDAPQVNSNSNDVSAQVMAMARSGFPPEQIAERLSCSLTEVQMILDMSMVSGGQ